jgi:dihydropteroate synthase
MLFINYVNKLGPVRVGGSNPVRIMGILNTSPESFYKKSIKKISQIAETAKQMEEDGADFVDVGGMSTAPYLSTMVLEKQETKRITEAIKQIQKATNLPISVDTCRSAVAKTALECGVDIINDISGLQYDKQMPNVIEKYQPSLVLCAYSKNILRGDLLVQAKLAIQSSLKIAKSANIKTSNITIDPAIGFFRKTGKNPFYTKINQDWFKRDLKVLQNLSFFENLNHPILISVSNKSFIGKLLNKKNPADRLHGSIAAEVIATLNGADVIRTHNVKETRDAVSVAQVFSKKFKKNL